MLSIHKEISLPRDYDMLRVLAFLLAEVLNWSNWIIQNDLFLNCYLIKAEEANWTHCTSSLKQNISPKSALEQVRVSTAAMSNYVQCLFNYIQFWHRCRLSEGHKWKWKSYATTARIRQSVAAPSPDRQTHNNPEHQAIYQFKTCTADSRVLSWTFFGSYCDAQVKHRLSLSSLKFHADVQKKGFSQFTFQGSQSTPIKITTGQDSSQRHK